MSLSIAIPFSLTFHMTLLYHTRNGYSPYGAEFFFKGFKGVGILGGSAKDQKRKKVKEQKFKNQKYMY